MPSAPPPVFSSPGKRGSGEGRKGTRLRPGHPAPRSRRPPGTRRYHRTTWAQAARRRDPPSPPTPLRASLRARSAATGAARCPGRPGPPPSSAATPSLARGPARAHRTWAGSGTRNWPGCPPPPRPRAVGWSGRPWPRRPRRLSAAARPAPGAGVACPGRPARPRPCGAGGGEPGARRAPSSAPHAAAPLRGGLRWAGGAAASGRVMSAAAPRRDRGGHGQWRGGAGAAARRQPMGGGMRRSGRRGGAGAGGAGVRRRLLARLRLPRGARPARFAPRCPPNARQPSAASAKPVVVVRTPQRGARRGVPGTISPPSGRRTPEVLCQPHLPGVEVGVITAGDPLGRRRHLSRAASAQDSVRPRCQDSQAWTAWLSG